MGCDIHLYTEKSIDFEGEKIWWCCDYFQLNESFLYDHDEPEYEITSIYTARDYDLFEILAGVRGFEENAIEPPRGLPDDVSDAIRKQAESWEGDGHSHSWFTAAELFDYYKTHKSESLKNLIKKIKKKMREEFYIYLCWTKEEKKEAYKKFADRFRIVFWFDN